MGASKFCIQHNNAKSKWAMLTKLTPLSRNDKKLDYRTNSASAMVALVIFHSQNALYQWEKDPVLLAVGWLKIN